MQPLLRLRLLGRFEAKTGDGALLQLPNRKLANLLAWLALEPEVCCDRAALASRVWPDSQHEDALASLRQALSLTRKALQQVGLHPDLVFQADRTSLAFLEGAVATDIAEFDVTAAASSESLLQPASELEPGLSELVRQRLSVVVLAAANRIRQSLSPAEAAESVIALADRWPENESLLRLSMESLADSGRGTEAIHRYRMFERRLRESLAMAPGEATVTLAKSIRGQAKRSLRLRQSNLSRRRDAFVGRDSDRLAAWEALLESQQLTLVGPGGVGKTRLATEIACDHAVDFHGQAWFVDLSGTSEPEHLVPAICEVVDEDPMSARSLSSLEAIFGSEKFLLVLDNLEQLGAGLAGTINALMESMPGLHVLATSRSATGCIGERVLKLDPLAVPKSAIEAKESPSVQLYLNRAAAVSPGAQSDDYGALAELAQKLEGMPLAICLAAAKADIYTPGQTLQALEQRFRHLETIDPDVSFRHKRLWNCIDWSHASVPECHSLLQKLSTFPGGFTVETASYVDDSPDLDQKLQRLLRSALVYEANRTTGVRFGMMESIREFVRESSPKGTESAMMKLQCEAMVTFLDKRQQANQAFNDGYIRDRVSEYENFRCAFEWAIVNDPHSALRISHRLTYFWHCRSQFKEGAQWISRAIAASSKSNSDDLAQSYRALAVMHIGVGEHEQAVDVLHRALELLPSDDPGTNRSRFLNSLGNAYLIGRQFEKAYDAFSEGHKEAKRAGNRDLDAAMVGNMGMALYLSGNLEEAEACLRVAVNDEDVRANNDWLAQNVHNLGLVLRTKGLYQEAREAFAEARRITEHQGVDPAPRGWLPDAALCELRLGDFEAAMHLILRGAAAVAKEKGSAEHAECIEAASQLCEAQGALEEAIALAAVVMRAKAAPQRSVVEPVPDTSERLAALTAKVGPDRARLAKARYSDLTPVDVLHEMDEVMFMPSARGAQGY